MIAQKAIPAQAHQSCRNVLTMGKRDKLVLEEACRRLIDAGGARRAVSYTAVKNMMAAVRKDHTTRPTGTTPRQGHHTSTKHYSGAGS
ncbi:hypothetical protein [Corynebacterium aquatimens]|uniref:hypothetical protein n=1 Tax=Corynebacterium aquatimens TaxID=1190508 RepID=UPI00253FE155|nr:hypothetical protein [Corynebacterium aquatimens]